MNLVFLRDAKVTLLSVSSELTDQGLRVSPVVAIHVNLDPVREHMPTQDTLYQIFDKQVADKIVEMGYRPKARSSITHVAVSDVDDEENMMMDVYFKVAQDTCAVVRVPAHLLSIAYTSPRDTSREISIHVVDKALHPELNPTRLYRTEDATMLLSFPDPGSDEASNLEQEMSGRLVESAFTPQAEVAWNADFLPSPVSKKDQIHSQFFGVLLPRILDFTHGNITPLYQSYLESILSPHLRASLTEEALEEYVQEGKQIFAKIIPSLLAKVEAFSPAITTAYDGEESGSKKTTMFNAWTHLHFTEMMEGQGMEERLHEVIRKETKPHTPTDDESNQYEHWEQSVKVWSGTLEEEWDESMLPIRDHLKDMGELSLMEKVAGLDYSNPAEVLSYFEEYGLDFVLNAVSLLLASKAHRRNRIICELNDEYSLTPQDQAILWCESEIPYWWEFSALMDSLANYEVESAVDVVTYGSRLPYLGVFIERTITQVLELVYSSEDGMERVLMHLEGLSSHSDENIVNSAQTLETVLATVAESFDALEEKYGEIDYELSMQDCVSIMKNVSNIDADLDALRETVRHMLLWYPILADAQADFAEEDFAETGLAEDEAAKDFSLAEEAGDIRENARLGVIYSMANGTSQDFYREQGAMN